MADIKTIDKLIPQYLNTDADERLVKSFEMVEALNIRVSHEDDGDSGVLKNIEGNVEIGAKSASDAMPAGVNRVIGSTSSEAGKCIYFFLYNSLGNHGIYRYGVTDDKYQKVYEDSVLNFAESGFVKGDVVINQFDEHLLYFTDNRNEPRKINVNKALNGGYSSVMTQGTDEEKELFLTVCKPPPLSSISASFITDSSLSVNNLKNKVFQFAYQYVYDDGEESTLSPWTSPVISPSSTAWNGVTRAYFDTINNTISLKVAISKGPVVTIRVFAKETVSSTFYQIEEVDNIPFGNQTFLIVPFLNDKLYVPLPEKEALALFHSVPLLSKSQAISNNRLFYGAYTEGFNNLSATDALLLPVYRPTAVPENAELETLPGISISNTGGTGESYSYRAAFGDVEWNPTSFDFPNSYDNATMHGSESVPTFEISLDSISNSNLSAGGSCHISALIHADEIGVISSGSQSDMFFESSVTVIWEDNNSQNLVSNCKILVPNSSTNHLSNLTFDGGGLNLSHDFLYPSGSTQASVGGQIAEELDGIQITATVSPSSLGNTGSSTDLSVPNFFEGYTCIVKGSESDSWLALWLSGAITFTITNTSYSALDNKITCVLKMTDIGLEFTKATTWLSINTSGQLDPNLSGWHPNAYGHNHSQFAPPDSFVLNHPDISPDQYDQHVLINPISTTSGSMTLGGAAQQNSLGFAIKDIVSGENKITTALRGIKTVSQTVEFLSQLDGARRSFKSGASHDFGVVYFDHRGRASGVQKIGGTAVAPFGGAERNGRNGGTEIDLKLYHTPPPWAKHWTPVYAGNSSYEKVIQVTIAEAALGTSSSFVDILSPNTTAAGNQRRVITGLEGSGEGVLFLSLRTIEGKGNSYKELKGANLSYEYKEGDVLKILQYVDSSGAIIRPHHEFKINGYHYFTDNEENPIKVSPSSYNESGVLQDDENTYRRTGWFLSVRDENITPFSIAEVRLGNSFFSQDCLVEILRPKKSAENQVYQEIGDMYPIITVSGMRTHGGDRRKIEEETFPIKLLSSNFIESTERLYVGDKLSGYSFIGGQGAWVGNVSPEGSKFRYWLTTTAGGACIDPEGFGYTVNVYVPMAPSVSGTSFHGAITLTTGDVVFRLREQMRSYRPDVPITVGEVTLTYDFTKPDLQTYDKYFVESFSVSDFYDSEPLLLGRAHVETPKQRNQVRFSSITYSEVSTLDSSELSFSQFFASAYPFKDYSSQYGNMSCIVNLDEGLLVMFNKKILNQPIGRTLIESAQGGQLVTSTEVLGKESYITGTYGPGNNPESVVERFGKIFFVDIEAGKVVSITSKGVSLISDVGMEAYFEYKFATLLEDGSVIHIPCGIDPENNEFIVTTPGFEMNDISVGDALIVTANTPADTTYEAMTSWSFNTTTISWDTEPSCWNMANDIEPWEEIGQGAIYLDKINDVGFSLIDPEFIASNIFNVAILNTAGTFRGVAVVKINQNAIDVGSGPYNDTVTCGESLAVAFVANSSIGAAETVAYSTTYEKWMSMYTFVPEFYGHIHNKFFSYNAGKMYRHNVNPIRNNFYSIQASSKVRLISNQNPSSIKTYNALSLESNNKKWAGVISNTNQTASMPLGMLQEKEGLMYSNIPRDSAPASTSKSTSHKIVLGEVTDVAGAVITFASRVSNLPFGLGDMVWKIGPTDTTTSLTVSEVTSRTSLTLSADASAAVLVGDTLMAISSGAINGDKIRDYYASVELTLSSTETAAVELYAVNMVYAPSNLHNEGTQGVGGSQKKA